MKKLNLGCGKDYKKGFVNLDYNKGVKADVYADINKKLPFRNNTFDYVLADNVIEHVEDFFAVMKELHRVCKNNAILNIYVPHYSSPNALKLPYHTFYFGIGSFDFTSYLGGMSSTYNNLNFEIESEKLSLFLRGYNNTNKILALTLGFLNKFNFVFNFNRTWRLLCERFWVFNFDEINYKLRVVK